MIDDEYEDESDYIEALYSCVVDLLSKRDGYLVAVKLAGQFIPFGPVYGLAQAKKYGRRFAGELRTEGFIQQLLAPSKLDDQQETKDNGK